MPIRKYHSLEEMNREPRWLPTGDPTIIAKIRYLWRLSEFLLHPVGTCIPRGVRKYRTIQEANLDRDKWETDRVEQLREARKRGESGQ